MGSDRFQTGDIFAGRYRIVLRIGSGATGEVYRAHDRLLDVPVALKLLRAGSALEKERWLEEVRLARQVAHPAVCRVFDVGESEGQFFFTMEYIDGEDLGSHLRRMGRLPAAKVLELARELCAGLAEAHRCGVLHRNLKPTSILVDAEGHARITDFGVVMQGAAGLPEGWPVGPPAYMAPEQLLPGGEITERTDLYALGLVLYELVTGRVVFDAETPSELLEQHASPARERPSRRVPEIDRRLERAILQALQEDPKERPASAQALAAALGAPLPEVAQRPAERRQLTVMFCDLVGSTQLAEQLDPEALREVVRAYQETAGRVVEQWAGRVAQYLGDGILVYFGYPEAHEDDAERAVRAGLAVVEAMRKELNPCLEREHGVELALRIGIHTGPVVVGEMGGGERRETLALGDTTNLAARLQAAAEPDSVVVSTATLRLVQGVFRIEALGPQNLKGVAEPVSAYRVLEPTGVRSRLEVATRLTPLVGRDPELGFLLERWEQAREGLGQAVLLSGEAGIGKSRVMLALRDRLGETPHSWLECRCSPYTQDSALYPVIELQREGLRFTDEDTSEERLRKLELGLERVGFPLPDTVPLLSAFHSLPLPARYQAPNLSPEGRRRKTLETLTEWVLRLGRQQPLLLLVEDLHWSDPSTLELLGRILDQIATAPVLAVFTHRPSFRPPWEPGSHVTPLQLGRLARKQSTEMVRAIAGGGRLGITSVEEIVRRTDGVPLFVEELTKAVLESGHTEAAEGKAEEGPSGIPRTLQDSLMARLDRLGAAKGLAQRAATLGRQFSHELLVAVWPEDEAMVRDGLARLVDAELLYQRGLAPEASYVFKHALIQEEAYQSLLKATRREYHQRIGKALEEHFSEIARSQPELVAHHYTKAELIQPAIDYWQRAAQRAVERSENLEALRYLDQALKLLRKAPQTVERNQLELSLRMLRSVALLAARGFAARDLEVNLERARALCDPNSPQLFPVLWGLTILHAVRGELKASEQAEQLLELTQGANDPILQLIGHCAVALASDTLGEHLRACDHFAQAINLYDLERHRRIRLVYGNDPALSAYIYSAWNLWSRGCPDQAWKRAEETLALAESVSDPLSLTHVLVAAACVRGFRREPEECRKLAERALVLATEQGFPHWVGSAKIMRGWSLAHQNETAAGLAQAQEGLALWRTLGVRMYLPYALGMLTEIYLKAGMARAARHSLEEALEVSKTSLGRFYEPELHRLRGELLLLDEMDASAAASGFCQGLALARERGARSLELRAATSLARLWQNQEKRQEAHQLLSDVYEGFTEGFDTPDLTEARALLDSLRGF